jgi:outer membrane protein OmpA-like peptidoglycan-associated protein
MRYPNLHLNRLVLVLAAASCMAALQGCGVFSSKSVEQASQKTHQILGEKVDPSYNRHLPLWQGNVLRSAGLLARLESSQGNIPAAVDAFSLDRLTIGMTEQDVVAALGAPAARNERGLWQYVVRDAQGPYAASLWFNAENRLWMGASDRAPLSSLYGAIVAVAQVVAEPRKRITLSASEVFVFNSDVLRKPQPKLDAIALALRGRNETIVVNGYTDRLGSDVYNKALSQRRADAVRAHLVRQGLSAAQVRAVGKGTADAVVACQDTKKRAALIKCLAPNRRVEIESLSIETAATR